MRMRWRTGILWGDRQGRCEEVDVVEGGANPCGVMTTLHWPVGVAGVSGELHCYAIMGKRLESIFDEAAA